MTQTHSNRPGYYQRVNARLHAKRMQKAFEQGFLWGVGLTAGVGLLLAWFSQWV